MAAPDEDYAQRDEWILPDPAAEGGGASGGAWAGASEGTWAWHVLQFPIQWPLQPLCDAALVLTLVAVRSGFRRAGWTEGGGWTRGWGAACLVGAAAVAAGTARGASGSPFARQAGPLDIHPGAYVAARLLLCAGFSVSLLGASRLLAVLFGGTPR
jgi:hypothetical protein